MGSDNYVLLQTYVNDELAHALKVDAVTRDLKLYEVHLEAIEHFLAHRAALQKRKQYPPYLFGRGKEKSFNVRLPTKVATVLDQIAAEDEVPMRRLLYTALVNYAATKKLIQSIGTIESGVRDRREEEARGKLRSRR